mgnify:CR=1 FL=1
MTTWRIWLDEFISLDRRMHVEGEPLSVREEHQYEYLKNILEAALGTKNTLMEDNRRTEPRIPVALPVSLSWENGDAEAFTVNLSWSGVLIDEDVIPKNVSKVKAKIVMEREGKEFEADCKIVWRSEDGTGLAFEELAIEQKYTLSYILTTMLEERVNQNLFQKLNKEDLKNLFPF